MKLLIISHTPHHLRNKEIVGWGPTVREIDYLAPMFEAIRHIAFLHSDSAPEASLPYSSKRVTLVPVKPSGGRGVGKKLGILAKAPNYISVMKKQLRWADIVHVRCPANISLMAVLLLAFVETPKCRWVFYAGNWSPDGNDSWASTLQRWWLEKGLHKGVVTINGVWRGQPSHVISFHNPCLTEQELDSARCKVEGKQLSPPFHFLFAGTLEDWKGVGRALQIVANLQRKGIRLKLDLAGDSKQRSQFERMAIDLGIGDAVQFHGWLKRSELDSLYASSHFLLFPSESEGFPKVLSEAMAHGVVPIAGAVGSIPQTLAALQCGITLPVHDVDGFVQVVTKYLEDRQRWNAESRNAILAAETFTYTKYLREVALVFQQRWQITLPVCENSFC